MSSKVIFCSGFVCGAMVGARGRGRRRFIKSLWRI